MKISYDPAKRLATLSARGLDFEDAAEVLEGRVYHQIDNRFDYGESRTLTAGILRGRMVMLVWTERGEDCHIISMRKANDREKARYWKRLS